MKKFILRFFGFIIVVLIINQIIKAAIPYWWGNPYYAEKIEYLKKEKSNYNLIFLGSSRIYRQIDPEIFDRVVSKDHNILILYTDRENRKDSEIAAAGFSRVDSIILDIPSLRQSEFNHIIESFLIKGDSRLFSDRKFNGLDYFIANTGESFISYHKENTVHKLRALNERNEIVSSVNFDPFWKSLSIRDKSMGADGNLHHILITNSYDKNIKKIMVKYSSLLSEKLKTGDGN